MGQIISIHSYRGGTGKSNVTANLAYLMAGKGLRVAVLDTDLQSPGVHVIFGLGAERITHTLTDFLFGKCDLEEAAYDVSADLGVEAQKGAVFLLPSSLSVEAILRVLHDGYDVGRLNNHFAALIDTLDLDVLLLDTHPGLNRETMLTTAVSDALVILIRPDYQDFHGTAVLVEVAGRLSVPRVFVVANKIASSLDPQEVRRRAEEAFKYEVIGALPLVEEMAVLGSRGIFAREYRDHPLSAELGRIADRLIEDVERESGK